MYLILRFRKLPKKSFFFNDGFIYKIKELHNGEGCTPQTGEIQQRTNSTKDNWKTITSES